MGWLFNPGSAQSDLPKLLATTTLRCATMRWRYGDTKSPPQFSIPDHATGHAIDVMVGGNTALGDAINADVLSQSGRFGVRYTIWQQTEHMPSGAAVFMANRGSPTANHRDHVHISVS
jgi:hypothetical protein